MEFDVKPYKQKGNTCAIACMLMILEYYKIIPEADWIYERKYYRTYKSKYMEGTPFSAIAWHLAKNGLNIEIIHSEKSIFKNNEQLLSKKTFDDAMDEYLQYLNDSANIGVKISNGISITAEMLKGKLFDDKMIILAGQSNGYLHAILICGYNNDNFIICDPLYKYKQEKTIKEVTDYMDTPLGKWCVVVDNSN